MATSTQDWIEELKGISVLELAERIKALEEEFGVSAAAVAAPVAAPGGAGGDGGGEDRDRRRRESRPGHGATPPGYPRLARRLMGCGLRRRCLFRRESVEACLQTTE